MRFAFVVMGDPPRVVPSVTFAPRQSGREIVLPQWLRRDYGEEDSDSDAFASDGEEVAAEFLHEEDGGSSDEGSGDEIPIAQAKKKAKLPVAARRHSSADASSVPHAPAAAPVWVSESPEFEVQPWDGQPRFVDRFKRGLKARAPTMTHLEWLHEFLPPSCIDMIVLNTNKYVKVMLPAREKPRWWRHAHWPPKWATSWKDLTADELWIHFGISYLMGSVKFPRIRDYWTESWPYYGIVGGLMSRKRFVSIRAGLHFVDSDVRPDNSDTFWKVRPILDVLLDRCANVAYCDRVASLDEEMILCKTKAASNVTQTVKNKPIRLGLLVRALVGSETKYLQSFLFVKKGMNIERTATTLIQTLTRRYHEVNMDNLYSRPRLFFAMLSLPMPAYGLGTWRKTYQVPTELIDMPFPAGKRWVVLYNTQVKCWGYKVYDANKAKPFFLLTTSVPPMPGQSLRRAKGEHERVVRDLSDATERYNLGMTGVDDTDAMRASNTTKRRSAKYTTAVLSWVLDVSAMQGFVCHSAVVGKMRHDKWQLELIKQIFAKYSPDKYRERTFKHKPINAKLHDNVGNVGRCAGCSKQTSMYCTGCRKYYCISARNCFFDHIPN